MSDLHRSPGDDHYSDEEWYRLTHDQPPTGSELVRVRTELVELCRLHAPASVREAEASCFGLSLTYFLSPIHEVKIA